jgi:signal transduction histidine kinase
MPSPSRSSRSAGEGERPSPQRPAEPDARGEALAEHLADRLARTEQELRASRHRAGVADRERALLSSTARHLAEQQDEEVADLVRLALPLLGDWCLVDEIQGGEPQRRIVATLPSVEREGAILAGVLPLTGDAPVGLPRALRRGRIERLESLPELAQPLADSVPALDDRQHEALASISRGPLLIVPVTVRGRITAALTFGRSDHGEPYGDAEERLAEEFATLLALAIEQRRGLSTADAAARAKAEFLAVMSHELRTPLNAIAGYAQLLEMGFRGPLTEGQRDAVTRIIRGQEHLLELVDAVLTFSRLTSGRIALDIGTVAADDLMAVASEPLVAEFAVAGVEFSIQPSAAGVVVQGDRERAAEILRHLLSNALKFTPRGGAVTLSCDAGSGLVRFAVTDTGRGIPLGQQEAIFHPFVQVEKGHTRSADGTGLGLSIGRELAERMGGSLTVTSEVGVGSRFVLSLNRAEDGVAAIDSPPHQG